MVVRWHIYIEERKKGKIRPLMDTEPANIELIERARSGDEKSLNKLAEQARQRLRVYVYRLTLNDDLTQEITQESLLEMCKILGKLKDCDKFWPWLYGIATNKLHRHHRTEQKFKRLAQSKAEHRESASQRSEGFENLVGQELKQIVSSAMRKLTTRHRAVLIMRCYDSMSYADISRSMQCSEFSTRMLFMRAKRSLQKELGRNGFGGKMLIPALILFGRITAPSEAAAAEITITAATTSAGVAAGVVSLVASKTAVVSVAAAGLLTVGSIVATSGPGDDVGDELTTGSPSGFVAETGVAEQCWYYFPQGPQGPVMMRAKSGGVNEWLQDDVANYSHRDNAIHVSNNRMYRPDLGVMRLPTDSEGFRAFLSGVDGLTVDMDCVTSGGKGLLVVAARGANGHGNHTWAVRHSNVLDEDYFQSDWPTDIRRVDDRDLMHRRGWTRFSITGNVGGRRASGEGRIPLVYAASVRYGPFLRLRIGDAQLVDDGGDALVSRGGAVSGRYPGGTFLRGLGRPWMGLHTMDTVRRDAAGYELGFTTERIGESDDVRVAVNWQGGQVIYTIDLVNDLVREIEFVKDGSTTGRLMFVYDQQVGGWGDLIMPSVGSSAVSSQDMSTLWLTKLAEGTLIE